MTKSLIIALLVFIILLAIAITVIVFMAKRIKSLKSERDKWRKSYNNVVELHEQNMEVISKYEQIENGIEPTSASYNSVVSNWDSGSTEEDSAKKTKS